MAAREAREASYNLADDYCRLRSSKSSWFSYYQQDHEEDCLTEESHLPLTPLEERVLSPCSDLEVDPGTDTRTNFKALLISRGETNGVVRAHSLLWYFIILTDIVTSQHSTLAYLYLCQYRIQSIMFGSKFFFVILPFYCTAFALLHSAHWFSREKNCNFNLSCLPSLACPDLILL